MQILKRKNKKPEIHEIEMHSLSRNNIQNKNKKMQRKVPVLKTNSFLLAFLMSITIFLHPLQAIGTSTPILGSPSSTVEKAKKWAGSHAKGATAEFISLADLYWKIAPAAGVDPAVAYAQAAHETGFGTFGGVIDASFYNPCGLKTSVGGDNNDPEAHMRFPDWQTGIQAHVDHLALYAGAPGYPKANTPDPRHFASLFGKVSDVENLGGIGKWAPSETYGERVAEMVLGVQLGYTPDSGVEQFVVRMYHTGLGRAADADGLAHWIKQLKDGSMTGAAIAESFLLSQELSNKNLLDHEYLQVLYVAVMNRVGDPGGLLHWEKFLKNGVSRTGILRQFILSAEFQGICDQYKIQRGTPKIYETRDENLELTTFISRQYRSIFDRNGDIDGLNYWSDLILNQNQSVESVAHAFLNSEEFMNRQYDNEDYVQILYWAFMDRAADKDGLTHWVGRLNQSTSANIAEIKQEIFEEFVYSEEFKNIIRSYGLTPSERSSTSSMPKPTPSPAPAPSDKPLAGKVIIIDAGHGGHEVGTAYDGKIFEKHLTLHMATLTRQELEDAGAKVVMTRTNDSWVSLYNRIALAHLVSMQYVREKGISPLTLEEEAWYTDHMENIRKKNAYEDSVPANQGIMAGTGVSDELKKLFAFEHKLDKEVIYISIHVNAAEKNRQPNPVPRGLQVYFPTDSAIEASEIRQENDGDFKNLSEDEFPRRLRYDGRPNAQNAVLASSLYNQILGQVPALEGDVSGTIAGNYAYLREHGLVCAMVETGFLTNPYDRELLQKKEVQAGIAAGIRDGCIAYFSK